MSIRAMCLADLSMELFQAFASLLCLASIFLDQSAGASLRGYHDGDTFSSRTLGFSNAGQYAGQGNFQSAASGNGMASGDAAGQVRSQVGANAGFSLGLGLLSGLTLQGTGGTYGELQTSGQASGRAMGSGSAQAAGNAAGQTSGRSGFLFGLLGSRSGHTLTDEDEDLKFSSRLEEYNKPKIIQLPKLTPTFGRYLSPYHKPENRKTYRPYSPYEDQLFYPTWPPENWSQQGRKRFDTRWRMMDQH